MGWMDFRSPALSSQEGPETEQPPPAVTEKLSGRSRKQGRGFLGAQITPGLGDATPAPLSSLPPNPPAQYCFGEGRRPLIHS